MYRRWAGNGDNYREEVILLSPLFIVGAPGGIGTGGVMTRPTPIPFTAITQENIHSQCLLNSEGNPVSPGGLRRFHLNLNQFEVKMPFQYIRLGTP